MKKIYITPSVFVHHLRVESQILAGTIKVNGAQNALTDETLQDLDLNNKEYETGEHDDRNPFIEVE